MTTRKVAMAGDEVPASSSTVVNDYAPGYPQTEHATRSAGRLPELAGAAAEIPRGALKVAIGAMAFQAFFSMTHFGWQYRAEYGSFLLLVVLLLVGVKPWRELAVQPVSRAVLLFTVFLVLQAGYVTWVAPVSTSWGFSEQLTTASKLVRLGVFSCLLGWWLSLVPRAIPYLFALMVLGLLSGVLIFMPWSELTAVFNGQLRPRFGIPENLAGQLAAVAGWLAVCLLIASWYRSVGGKRKATLIVIGLTAYVGCFCALLFSQSRGAWLAFAVTLPAVMIGLWWMRSGSGRATRVLPVVIVAVLSAIMLLAARDIVSVRLSSAERLLETETASEAAGIAGAETATDVTGAASAMNPSRHAGATSAQRAEPAGAKAPESEASAARAAQEDVAVKAVNIRLQLYELGVAKWRERPWFGWGMRSTHELIADANLNTGGVRHVHMHNAYLDALVGIGLVGAGLLGLVFVLLMRELLLAWRSGVITTATLWVFAGCFGIVLVANAFDSLLWRFEYSRAPLEILFGCCVAYGLIRRRNSAAPQAHINDGRRT
jgi:hypothetical protein